MLYKWLAGSTTKSGNILSTASYDIIIHNDLLPPLIWRGPD